MRAIFLYCLLFVPVALLAGCATREPVHQAVVVPEEAVQPMRSPGAKFALLPSAVQQTITAQAGAAEIQDINKIPLSNRDVYEITFRNSGVLPTLYIAEDGTLINGGSAANIGAPGQLRGTATGDGLVNNLPPAVHQSLQQTAPNAVVVDAQRHQIAVYEISFKDPALNPKLMITEDGTVLGESAP
jgi:hypothetical protein